MHIYITYILHGKPLLVCIMILLRNPHRRAPGFYGRPRAAVTVIDPGSLGQGWRIVPFTNSKHHKTHLKELFYFLLRGRLHVRLHVRFHVQFCV
jgi:hypothetical protein